MGYVDKLHKIFRDHFGDDSSYEFHTEESESGQVVGVLTLDAFQDKAGFERQNMIWNVLDEELDDDERFRITIIIANTPQETALQSAEQRAEERIKRAREQHNP